MKTLVIGGGRISLSHIPQILSSEKVSDLILVETSFINRLILKNIFNIKAYKDLSKALKNNQYKNAFILTPPSSHYELCKLMLENKVNVFIEKPFTLDPRKSLELKKLAVKNSLSLQVGYVLFHNPFLNYYKNLLCQIINADQPFEMSISMYGNVVNENSKGWRFSGKDSGCIGDYGCHILSLADYLIGPMQLHSLQSYGSKFENSSLDYFEANFFARHKKHISVKINADWAKKEFRKAEVICEVIQNETKITFDSSGITLHKDGQEKKINFNEIAAHTSFYIRGEDFSNQLDSFLNDCLSTEKDYENLDISIRTDEYIENINEKIT